MEFVFDGKPETKIRHRSFRSGGKTCTYDPKTAQKDRDKYKTKSQMASNRIEMACKSPTHVDMYFGIPLQKNASRAKRSQFFVTTKPDIDNYIKYYLDVLNGIAYHDDNQISSVYAVKHYSHEPKTKIILSTLGENMVTEHAITTRNPLTVEQIDYLAKKANNLGKKHRTLYRVYTIEDDEGTHYYFETQDMKKKHCY